MSEKKAMQTELGIIGQRYENRKNKKSGILEERDDKKKQLIFKADDGKSFIVMYSTFRSDWRKVKEGETEIKIAPAEKKSDKQSGRNNDKKSTKTETALTDKEHQELRMQTMDAVLEAIESAGLDCKVKITSKTKGIVVRQGRSKVMEIYVVNKDKVFYSTYFGCEVELPKTYGATYDYFANYPLKHRYRMDDLHLKEFVRILKNQNKEEK